MTKPVHVGIIGSQFISSIHTEAMKSVSGAEVLAVASPTADHARQFAKKHAIPHHFSDYKKMFEMEELDLVLIGAANQLHCQMTVDAAAAGKHVVCEKPLCMNLAEADRMIDACRKAGVKLMYAEELCFAPKYVRLKKLLDDGCARGRNALEAGGKARRATCPSLLGRESERRRSHDGHGMPRNRVLPLASTCRCSIPCGTRCAPRARRPA